MSKRGGFSGRVYKVSSPSVRDLKRRYRQALKSHDLLMRALQESEKGRQHAVMTLLAVLAHSGGQVTITAGTLQQVTQNAARMAYDVQPGAENPDTKQVTEFVVTLVERDQVEAGEVAPAEGVVEEVEDADV